MVAQPQEYAAKALSHCGVMTQSHADVQQQLNARHTKIRAAASKTNLLVELNERIAHLHSLLQSGVRVQTPIGRPVTLLADLPDYVDVGLLDLSNADSIIRWFKTKKKNWKI